MGIWPVLALILNTKKCGYNWEGVACICFDTEHSFIGISKKCGYNWEGVACICFDTEH